MSTSDFVPKTRLLSNVTVAVTPTITTTVDHGYSVGQFIRMHVNKDYNMILKGLQTKILSVPTTTTAVIDLDTSREQAYSSPSFPPPFTQAHTVPITGETQNIGT